MLWARQGLLDLPQKYILGGKYLFKCKKCKVGMYTLFLWCQGHTHTWRSPLWKVSKHSSLVFFFQCPMTSPIALTTEVTFADITVYPEPPRGSPQPNWKFAFGFFTRGIAELDGHFIVNSSDAEKVMWSLMLFTIMLLTGLEFFTR